jgi:putative membrane protein
MTKPLRQPAIFSADDPRLEISAQEDEVPSATAAAADLSDVPVESMAAVPVPPARRIRWGTVLWSALSALAVLALGLAVTAFIEEVFTRAPWLGAFGLALALLAGLALAVLTAREAAGLLRLAKVDALRSRALAVIESDDRERGRALIDDMLVLARRIPSLARGRARLAGHRADIIDGRDLVRLAERELMAPLDVEARRLVVAASKRVSVVTALSPRAAIDMVFVLVNALSLVRRLATLYGARPGTLGVLKLFRRVIAHLAVTGGVALSDSLLQQLIGHGLAARLSARLGEGMVNGLLTARLGLLAIDLVRPLPFYERPRPALNVLASTLLRDSKGAAAGPQTGRPSPPDSP